MKENPIKKELLAYCKYQIDQRYLKIKQTIQDIEESLMEESKNTSGDKHETGRAMLQIDRENAGKQLLEIEKLMDILQKIDIKRESAYARLGSLVRTDKYNYFISLSVGAKKVDGVEYFCVALNSPVGMQLSGKQKGDSFEFNNIKQPVLEVE